MSRPSHTIHLFPWELESIDDYSCSLPTGTTSWKMWRRGLVDRPVRNPIDPAEWRVGQYLEPIGDRVPIRWFAVVVRRGPKPQYWSDLQRWKQRAECT